MTNNMNNKGQINIFAVISVGITISLFTIGGYFAQNIRTDDRIRKSDTEINTSKERIATLEEAIKTIKDDNAEIKSDIKLILKELK